MLSTIDELIRHKWWANAGLLHAIEEHPAAAEDEELRKMLHHILVANRFWLLTILGHAFVREDEMRIPGSLSGIVKRFKETERLESEWLAKATDPDLDRTLETVLHGSESMSRSNRLFCRSACTPKGIVLNAQRVCVPSAERRPAWITFCGSKSKTASPVSRSGASICA